MLSVSVSSVAKAVENAAVILLGVSRAYKESSNCRMEAQYGLQKKKPMIPLKMVKGYEADGWLGLIMGTSLYYAFYGDTLSSESAFESRIDALSRELGDRGRMNDLHQSVPDARDSTAELTGMKLARLQAHATEIGVAPDAIEDAMEMDTPKVALIAAIERHQGI